jgi:hypothetical protein
MHKGVIKLVVFNGKDFSYWKNQTLNYLLSQGRAIWEIVREAYVILAMLDNTTHGEVQRYENNYKALKTFYLFRFTWMISSLLALLTLLCHVFRK